MSFEYPRHAGNLLRSLTRTLRALHGGPRRRRIAIGLVEHMGDIVAAEPLVRRLRADEPGADLFWFAREEYRPIVEATRHVDRFVPVHCLTEWAILRHIGRFDRVVDMHLTGRICPQCRLRVPIRSASPLADVTNYYHHGNLLTAFARAAGLPEIDESPVLHIPVTAARRVDALGLPSRYAVLHARSNDLRRDWDEHKWPALRDSLQAMGLETVEIGRVPVLAAGPRHRNLCGAISALDMAEVIRRSALFVGVDSGPAHLAHAVGARSVLILGRFVHFSGHTPYSGRYGRGEGARIVRAEGPAADVGVRDVVVAAEGLLLGTPGVGGDLGTTAL